ncbi:MAG TPA: cell envelope integrity protein CreD [Cyclobacteriaceae bacterium]|nr:cell envelope integrity protein CreD [Cyclobacteriaceae bacterium]HRJ83000.1 cell envelope integrity protein CreD [Cyclobacteriaceae bacterium]
MEPIKSTNLLDRFNQWLKESITVKLVSIGFLILILLIPAAWIESMMEERQQRAESVIAEVSNKWSGNQTLSGPILVVPYKHRETIKVDKDQFEIKESTRKAFFLPETLDINGTVNPEKLHRGIFDAVVYESSLMMKASFSKPDFKRLEIAENMILWPEAHLIIAISDLRGISKNPPVIKSGNQSLTSEPAQNIGVSTHKFGRQVQPQAYDDGSYPAKSATGIVAPLNWSGEADFTALTEINFNLKGSSQLNFVPSGKTTSVKLSGPWPDPSFDGEFLPATREVSEKDFTATWNILHFNRPFAQQWKDSHQELVGSEFGLKLLIPVDQYQKSIRTAKYGILIIMLTFVALFLVEITQKIRIHPFQYILIGAALIIYYTLLLSFSEQVGYNVAYWISSIATVALIAAYSTSFLRDRRFSLMFTTLLVIFYSFIFIIILQQDFSLLIGSIGLFLIVATLMYFSRKVDWYKDSHTVE